MIASARGLPAPDPAWAFFLDVDGTLAELAPSPPEARIGATARRLITALHASCGGALALVSGRPVAEVDAMSGASHIAVAGLHGLERRNAAGAEWRQHVDQAPLRIARARLAKVVARNRGLLLEDKGTTLALHYRGAPALASFAHRAMREAQEAIGSSFYLQGGKRVVELRPAGQDKGTAVAAFMSESPFRGRVPVYLGDDATDERAFVVVNEMGGYSIKVGSGASRAQWRLPGVAAVHDWLARSRVATLTTLGT